MLLLYFKNNKIETGFQEAQYNNIMHIQPFKQIMCPDNPIQAMLVKLVDDALEL